MVTTTTSPRLTKFPPSKIASLPSPPVNAPPCIQNITGFNSVPLGSFEFGINGVKMLMKRQSSFPVPPIWIHGEPKESADMLVPDEVEEVPV